ncbi:MAG: cupin domain-containing protein [Candidatus Izemoplasmatales bacterium]
MPVGKISELNFKEIKSSEAKDARIAVMVGKDEGWDGYVMRTIEVEKDGYTPKHSHPWPHINYIIEGKGSLLIDGVLNPVEAGSYAYVPGNKIHQFKNEGTTPFKFICIVPEIGHQY